MRSDSFASQVLGNIARTAQPFADRQFGQAEDRITAEAEPRSFFSWLRHALAYEPLHDDSPGRDEMRIRRGEEGFQPLRPYTLAPQPNPPDEAVPVQPEDHRLHEHQAQEPVDQPIAPAAAKSDAEWVLDAARQVWLALATLESAASTVSAREVRPDEVARDRVRLLLELLRTTDLNSLDPSDPLYAQYLGELIALRGTLDTVLGRSQVVLSSQRRSPRSGLADADLSDEQPPDQPATHRSSSAGSGRAQELVEGVEFLTVAEVASVMRVTKMTVHRLVHSGHLPAIRVGRSFRVPANAVDEYLRGKANALSPSGDQTDGQ